MDRNTESTGNRVPEMSVIVLTTDDYASISHLMKHLHAQDEKHRCELLLLCPDKAEFHPDMEMCAGFAQVRVIEVGRFDIRGSALAMGIFGAQAPVVALTEDHSFPHSGWIHALLKAHEGPWAAVSATLENANPDSPVSWCDLLVGHGAIAAPQKTQEADRLGGHNVSYKRDVLLNEFGDKLGQMLDTEPIHHEILRAKGYRLLICGEAVTRHTNFETLRGWLSSQFYHGRLYGATRWERWTAFERIRFLVGAPTSPAIRILRMLRMRNDAYGQYKRIPKLIPLLALGITTGVTGEVLGCLFGKGKALVFLTVLEFKRYRFYSTKYHKGNSAYTD